ncbi:MAG: HpcH/HpaI aldolase/citrate lyase family protein [Anaerolineales bacterium]
MRPRRALLYVPGSDWPKMEKAAGLEVDSVCLDLEDGVAANKKSEARDLVVRALKELDFGASEKLVRINSVGSGLQNDDLKSVLSAGPEGFVMPKVTDSDQVRAVSLQLAGREIRLLLQIESALGVVNLKEIATSDERVDALIFGAEDYASDVGAKRTPEAEEVFYVRSAVVTYAAAFGLQAIDMLWTNFKDAEGLLRLAVQGARLGYSGMQIIHPDQISPVQKAFTPSADEIAAARRIVESYENHLKEGLGAFALEGKMVDMPIIKAAQRVLSRAGMEK